MLLQAQLGQIQQNLDLVTLLNSHLSCTVLQSLNISFSYKITLTTISGPTIYASLGFNTEKQLQLQAGWVTLGVVANLLGAVILDRVGRKPLLIIGLVGTCICLIIEAAMVASFAEEGSNKAGLRVGVAAIYLFLFLYSMGIDVS